MKRKKRKITPFSIFNYVFLTALCTVCMIPFINLLAVSFSDVTAVISGQVTLWPVDFTVSSYEYALFSGRFTRSLLNSLIRTVLGASVNVVMMMITAYPLSKNSRQVFGRNVYMVFFVFTMIFSGGMIPTYIVVSKLGLKDSIWALILPGALPIYNTIILMNFMRGIPDALEEAAIIDGASPIQVLIKVLFPLLKPALATVGLFSIVNHWNAWFDGMIYMNDINKYPLQTYLQSLLRNMEEIMRSENRDEIMMLLEQMDARTARAAQLFLGALPVIMIYPFLQKYFTKGLVLGSVKG